MALLHHAAVAADCQSAERFPVILDPDEWRRRRAGDPGLTWLCKGCARRLDDAGVAIDPDAPTLDGETPDYLQGWYDGKGKAFAELRNYAQGYPPHHRLCDCQLCQTARAVISGYRSGNIRAD